MKTPILIEYDSLFARLLRLIGIHVHNGICMRDGSLRCVECGKVIPQKVIRYA